MRSSSTFVGSYLGVLLNLYNHFECAILFVFDTLIIIGLKTGVSVHI